MKSKLFLSSLLIAFGFMFVLSSCDSDDDPIDDNPTLVEDGFYLSGTATGSEDINALFTLKAGRIEGDGYASLLRDGMYEGFYYLQTGDFTIFEKAGSNETKYGADAVETVTLDGEDSQIHGDIVKGTFKADGAAFSISKAGVYHVVFDVTTSQIMYTLVNSWGIIGDATPDGWSGEEAMTEVSLDANGGSWKIENLVLREGSYKFRYNNGWKIALTDFTVFSNVGGDDNGNPIMGGGGWSITKDDAAIYTVEFKWSAKDGFSYTLTKTGDLSETDWTGVVLDAVGSAISADNANAIADPSAWGWGQKLLADNNGEPTLDGTVYTWTWTEVIVLDSTGGNGFKLRTEDGVAPANGNGASFDVGYSAVDTENSSENVIEVGGNIAVAKTGTYTFKITIDAANGDEKVVTITEGAPTPELYMTGAAVGGWDWTDNYVTMTWISGNKFEATTEFISGEAFRFFAQADWNPDSYNYPYFTTVDANFENANDGDSNLRFIGTTGNYKITVDLDAKTVALEAAK